MVNINKLDDLILVRVFSKLSIRDLLKLTLVCRRWQEIHILACANKQKLAILAKPPQPPKPKNVPPAQNFGFMGFGNDNDDFDIPGLGRLARLNRPTTANVPAKPPAIISPLSVVKILHNRYGIKFASNADRLRVTELTERNSQFLINRFPNVTELEIVENQLEPVVDLINNFLVSFPALSKLKVIIVGSETTSPQEAWNLLALSINALTPFLRNLTIYDHHNGCPRLDQLTNLFSIEEFFCGGFSAGNPTQAFSIVDNFITIRTFGLFGVNYTDVNCTGDGVCNNLKFPLQSGQVHKLIYCPDTPCISGNFLKMAAQKFNSLGSLHIKNTATDFKSFYYFVECISSLVNLRELRMFYFPRLFFGEGLPSWRKAGEPTLPSVTHLHLDSEFVPHAEFESIDQLMPNLMQINIQSYEQSCRHIPENDYNKLGTDCYPNMSAFADASTKPVLKDDEEWQREENQLLKKCEDHFIERPVLRRLLRLREVCLGKNDSSTITRNDPLFIHYRVAHFSDGRKLMGSVKFVSL